ncbi:hypothetical protein Droror1_Dr00018888 [Drosera rotundifolia]
MYTSVLDILSVDPRFVSSIEPLLMTNKVDLAMFGHVHNYERTCAVYEKKCVALPSKDANGTDTYDNTNYSAPVQVIIGAAGFKLDSFSSLIKNSWSLSRISEFGYARMHATTNELKFEFVNANTREAEDTFRIINNQS